MRLLLVAAGLCTGASAWADKTTVGAYDESTSSYTTAFWGDHSDYYTIEPNKTLTLTFQNHSAGGDAWKNFIVALTNDVDRGGEGYYEYAIFRADNYAWQTGTFTKKEDGYNGKSTSTTTNVYNKNTGTEIEPSGSTNGVIHNWYTSLTNNISDWDAYRTDLNGANVTVTITRRWAQVTIRADVASTNGNNNTYYEQLILDCGNGGSNLRAFLSVENAQLTNIASSTSNTSVNETTVLFEAGTTGNEWTSDNTSGFYQQRYIRHTSAGSQSFSYTGDSIKQVASRTAIDRYRYINPTADAIINVEAECWLFTGTGKYFADGLASFFRFGNIWILANDQNQSLAYSFSPYTYDYDSHSVTSSPLGTGNYTSVGGYVHRKYDNTTTQAPSLIIKMQINTATNTLVSMTVERSDNSIKLVNLSNVVLSNPDYSIVSIGALGNSGTNVKCTSVLKSLKISQTAQVVTLADYTVAYKDSEGNTIKESEVRTGVVGEAVSLTDADKEDFYTGTVGDKSSRKKWHYASDDADEEGNEIADDGSTVVTVTFSEVAKYDYTVNTKCGDIVLPYTIEGWQFNGETVYVPFPRWQAKNGNLYSKKVSSTSSYQTSFVLSSAGQIETLTYTDEETSGIVYWSEAEEIAGGTFVSATDRNSQQGAASFASKTTLTTLEAGRYKMVIGLFRSTSANVSSSFTAGANTITATTSSANFNEITSSEFVVADDAELAINAGSYNLDFVYVQRLGDAPTTVSATMGLNGYTTFCSALRLDLGNLPSGLKAYTASLDESTLSFTNCTSVVPEGTGLLLMGTAEESYDIPVVTTDAANVTSALVGVTYPQSLKSTVGGIYYFVMKKATTAEDALAFAPLSTASAVTIPAGKAYVALDTSAGARSLTVAFDDETTGINSVNGEGIKANGFYNLNGQRVESPTKGLYIMNGKKVILK